MKPRCKKCGFTELDCECDSFEPEKVEQEPYNPPPYTEGHNPFGKGGIYVPGDPGF